MSRILSSAIGAFKQFAATAGAKRIWSFASQSVTDAARGPLARESSYTGNRGGYSMVPEISELLDLLWSGRISDKDLTSLLDQMAVGFVPGQPGPYARDQAWANSIELSRPMLDLELYRKFWLRGALTDMEMLGALAREGFTTQQGEKGYRDNTRNVQLFLSQGEWLSAVEALSLYWSGQLGDNALEEIRRLLRAAGYTDTSVQDQLLSIGLPYTAGEALTLRNREIIDDERLDRMLSWAGLHDEKVREEAKNLRFEVPGPSDLVRFAVRHVFEPDLVKRFEFWQEMPDAFEYWHKQQGLGYDLPPVDYRGKGPEPWTWAKAHWWAHWVWPSPDMAFRMFQRFRPPEPGDVGPRDPSGLVFTDEDLSYLLRGNDYPPHWRPFLTNLAYRPLDVRSVRWGRQFNIIDGDESRRRYQDMGYSQENSLLLAEIDGARFADRDNAWIRSEEQAIKKRAHKCTMDAFDTGIISEDTAKANMAGLGFSDALQAMEIGVHNLCSQVSAAKQAIKEVRSLYLRGWLDQQSAADRLDAMGIVAESREDYVALWQLQLTPRRQRLSTQHVLKELEGGFITTQQAIAFLGNLGWSEPELTILLADASRAVATAIAKQQAAAEKTQKARAKEVTAAAKATKQAYDQMLAELRRVEPLTMLVSLATKGLISRDEFIARLTDHGIPARSQSYYLEKAYGNKEGQPNGTSAAAGQSG